MQICHFMETFSRRVLEVSYQMLNKSLMWLGKPEITKAGNVEWTGSGSSGRGRCFHGELVEYFEVGYGGIGSFVILLSESLDATTSILQYSFFCSRWPTSKKNSCSVGDLEITKNFLHFGDGVVSSFFFFFSNKLLDWTENLLIFSWDLLWWLIVHLL